MARLRPKLSRVAGARLYLFPRQDLRMGGRKSFAQFQYTLQGDTAEELYQAAPKLVQALRRTGLRRRQFRPAGGRAGEPPRHRPGQRLPLRAHPRQIDNTLYDAFGQRQVSTIYNPLKQYHVVMEIAPRYLQSPDTLKTLFVSTSGGKARGSATPTRWRVPWRARAWPRARARRRMPAASIAPRHGFGAQRRANAIAGGKGGASVRARRCRAPRRRWCRSRPSPTWRPATPPCR